MALALSLGYVLASSSDRVLAQIISPITPDTTLGSENSKVTRISPRVDQIERGARRGTNLFHSFEEFNVGEGRSVLFANPPGVENILTRVTGTNSSNILGTLGVTGGNANLFLINPNGILFGRNARLDVKGSFFASTANSLVFDNGFEFSANKPTAPPLLTINVPIGLQYGSNPESIVNRSRAIDKGQRVGLEVQRGKTLGLIGGSVTLDGGRLTGGQIELGSVANNSLVNLIPQGTGFTVGYQGVQNFKDIQLSESTVNGRGNDIQIRGQNIQLSKSSLNGPFRDLHLQGQNIQLFKSSLNGPFRDLHLQGQNIQLFDESNIAPQGVGNLYLVGQNIQLFDKSSITASDIRPLVYLQGQNIQLSNQSRIASLKGGDIQVRGESIQLSDGSTIVALKGGNLTVDASELVELIGTNSYISQIAVNSSPDDRRALTINTKRLIVRDGAQIQALTEGSVSGGSLTVNATESVKVIGSGTLSNGEVSPSQLIAASGAATGVSTNQAPVAIKGPGGNLTINTQTLLVQDGAQVSVNSNTSGNAGNLEIVARSILLNNEGKLTAISDQARGGNIRLVAEDLVMRDRSLISAQSLGGNSADGNIYMDVGVIVAIPSENSDIIARSTNQGNIEIKTQGIFGLEFREQLTPNSDITASGTIIFNPPDVDPTRGLTNLPTNLVDASNQINQACSANGGNVAQNELTITGRGGLPDSPNETLSSDAVWTDLRTPATVSSTKNSKPVANRNSQRTIVEANGWAINDKGQVVLTSTASTTPHRPWVPSITCPAS